MPQNVSFFNPENEAKARKQQLLAQQLMQYGKPRETQVVSGIAVPQSNLQGLVDALSVGVGMGLSDNANQLAAQDAKERQQFLQSAVSQYGNDPKMLAQALMGQPATADAGFNLYKDAMSNAERAKLLQMRLESGGGSDGGATGALASRVSQEMGIPFTDALYLVQTGWRQGTQYGGGGVAPIQGVTEAKKDIKSAEASGTAFGKDIGEAEATLRRAQASMPNLYKVVDDLSELGKKATYTYAGRGVDIGRTQLGMEPREAAVARREYIAKVDNEILPLLRTTFGAQFTQKEGESLKATLGDPNATPEEKDAVLKAFIEQKTAQIGVLQNTVAPNPVVLQGATGETGAAKIINFNDLPD